MIPFAEELKKFNLLNYQEEEKGKGWGVWEEKGKRGKGKGEGKKKKLFPISYKAPILIAENKKEDNTRYVVR